MSETASGRCACGAQSTGRFCSMCGAPMASSAASAASASSPAGSTRRWWRRSLFGSGDDINGFGSGRRIAYDSPWQAWSHERAWKDVRFLASPLGVLMIAGFASIIASGFWFTIKGSIHQASALRAEQIEAAVASGAARIVAGAEKEAALAKLGASGLLAPEVIAYWKKRQMIVASHAMVLRPIDFQATSGGEFFILARDGALLSDGGFGWFERVYLGNDVVFDMATGALIDVRPEGRVLRDLSRPGESRGVGAVVVQ